jgi:tetrahydromethanopterin S-methyltransferase subunit G
VAKGKLTEVKSIDLVSCVKVSAGYGAVVGLILGILVALAFITIPVINIVGLASIVFFAVLGAVLGAVCGLLKAAIYNFVAAHIGGVRIELK